MIDDFPYATASYRMRPGETLCLVTDGVTEAFNAAGEPYGRERLEAVLAAAVTGGQRPRGRRGDRSGRGALRRRRRSRPTT